MISYPEARKLAVMIAAIGEPTRMLALHRLIESERTVGELADLLGIPIVNMSHHLGVMRQGGLVENRKEGRNVVYQIKPELIVDRPDAPDVLVRLRVYHYTVHVLKSKPATPPAKSKSGR